jgi:hypothetical protein
MLRNIRDKEVTDTVSAINKIFVKSIVALLNVISLLKQVPEIQDAFAAGLPHVLEDATQVPGVAERED